jgi:hypothetical protein
MGGAVGGVGGQGFGARGQGSHSGVFRELIRRIRSPELSVAAEYTRDTGEHGERIDEERPCSRDRD